MPDTCVGRDSKPLTGTMLQKPMTSASSCSLVFGMVFLFFIGQAASPTLPLVRAFNGDQSGTRAGELLSHSAPAQMLAPGREFSRLPETEHSLDKTSQTNSIPAGMAYIFSIAIAVGPASTSAGPINPQT